jgi:hypothetical protein
LSYSKVGVASVAMVLSEMEDIFQKKGVQDKGRLSATRQQADFDVGTWRRFTSGAPFCSLALITNTKQPSTPTIKSSSPNYTPLNLDIHQNLVVCPGSIESTN